MEFKNIVGGAKMGVKIISKGRETIALLDGDIDHHTAKSMREEIDITIDKKGPSLLKLDFSGVQFMDSSGIGLIMGRYKNISLKGGKLKVVNMPSHIERIVKLSGLGALGVLEEGCEKNESN